MRMLGCVVAAGLACGTLLAMPAFAAPSQTCQRYGEIAFRAWTQGLYAKVGQHFAPQAAKHLPASVLHAEWVQLESEEGPFKSLGQFKPMLIDGHERMIAPIYFGKKRFAALFVCNLQDQVAGLQVLDPANVPALKGWSPGAK